MSTDFIVSIGLCLFSIAFSLISLYYSKKNKREANILLNQRRVSKDALFSDVVRLINKTRGLHIVDFIEWYEKKKFIQLSKNDYRDPVNLKHHSLMDIVSMHLEDTTEIIWKETK